MCEQANFRLLTTEELRATLRGSLKRWRRAICRGLLEEGRIPDQEPSLTRVRLKPSNSWNPIIERANHDAAKAVEELERREENA